MQADKKRVFKKGFLAGTLLSLVILFVVIILEYDGKCGISVLGGANERYVCTLPEYLFFDSNGSILTLQFALYYFWWLILIIIALSILGTYIYYKRKNG